MREAVRMRAVDMFEQHTPVAKIAKDLRVSLKSVYAWRQAWRRGGRDALVSKGPGGALCRLDHDQVQWLAAALDAGPAVFGWVADQRWTLPRVTALIGRLFGVRYTERGVAYLLHRIGWSPQVPVHRAVQRDEAAIADWRECTWAQVKAWPGASGRGWSSRTRPGSR